MPDDADEHVHCFPSRWGRKVRPEERLAIAVLEDAFRTLQRYAAAENRAGRRLVADVEEWFACDDTSHPFTFVAICDALALDVSYVRSGLRQWRESRRAVLQTEARVLHLIDQRRPGPAGAPVQAAPGSAHFHQQQMALQRGLRP
jgi:hypothetical protein